MDDKSFRILLDLSELNFKSYKYVWMSISLRELKTIRDLKQAVITKFGLSGDINFFLNHGLLLEEEKILVLRENDSVKLSYEELFQPLENSNRSESSFQVFNLEADAESAAVIEVQRTSAKKRKRKSEVLSPEVVEDSHEKRKKKSKKRKKMHKKSHTASKTEENIILENASDSTSSTFKVVEDVGSTDTKKKHKMSYSTSTTENSAILQSTSVATAPTLNIDEDLRNRNKNFNLESKVQSKCESPKFDNNLKPNAHNNVNDIPEVMSSTLTLSGNNCKKNKRKRRRKRKQQDNPLTPFLMITNTDISSNRSVENKSPDRGPNNATTRKHIIFTSPTHSCDDSDQNDINLTNEASIYELKNGETSSMSTAKTNSSPNISTPNSNFYSTNNSWTPNSVQNESTSQCFSKTPQLNFSAQNSPMHLQKDSFPEKPQFPSNETAVSTEGSSLLEEYLKRAKYASKKSKKLPVRPAAQNLEANEVSMQNESSAREYTVLNSLPPLGAHIAFKVLELDESYSPTVSGYKEGIVKGIDPDTDELEVNLIQAEYKAGRIGKFENLQCEEIPPAQVIQKMTLQWSSLIEPLLVVLQSEME